MKTVVVTGSTRGIGRGLVQSFAQRGCNVVVSGRSQAAVDRTVGEINQQFPGRAAGAVCEVAQIEQLEALWQTAVDSFGQVDVWINNAGMSIKRVPLAEADAADLHAIVQTNLTGALLASKVAIQHFLQQGFGQLWEMEGFGSTGMTQPGMAPYGATKRGVNYLIKALQKELKDTPVQVCTLSPGIVVTDLLIADYDTTSAQWAKTKKVLNILADKVETVTPWLADKVLATNRSGATVAWLTRRKAFARFAMAGFRKRDVFAQFERA